MSAEMERDRAMAHCLWHGCVGKAHAFNSQRLGGDACKSSAKCSHYIWRKIIAQLEKMW